MEGRVDSEEILKSVFATSDSVRYVALYRDGTLASDVKTGLKNASASDSDVYEELLVNPGVLTLLGQRGKIDCGGLDYVLIRYGSFFQLVIPISRGHLSVCIEPNDSVLSVVQDVVGLLPGFDSED